MDITDPYARALEHQVSRMLELATARHPQFLNDCLTDPWLIAEKWGGQPGGNLCIDRVDSIVSSGLAEQNDTVVDDQHDLLGLFRPAMGSEHVNRIEVQYELHDYTARRNFTLLHEIGHYLQQTSDELVDNLISISSLNTDKRFEEEACNRFASVSLLPRSYVETNLHGGIVDADVARRMYEQSRKSNRSKKIIRVSRPAIARRLADFLAYEGSVALVYGDRLELRAHRNGRIDYEGGLTAAETSMIGLMRGASSRSEHIFRPFISEGGAKVFASIADTPAGRNPRYFIVTQFIE